MPNNPSRKCINAVLCTFEIPSELLPEDYDKRLLISVWHRELRTQKSSLLGCMAFTVKHLLQAKKQVDGWYYLLAPSFGRHKHLAVDKVTMLTYYDSVDSGLQTTGHSSQDEESGGKEKGAPRKPAPSRARTWDRTDYSEILTSTTTSSSSNSGRPMSSPSARRNFFAHLVSLSPLKKGPNRKLSAPVNKHSMPNTRTLSPAVLDKPRCYSMGEPLEERPEDRPSFNLDGAESSGASGSLDSDRCGLLDVAQPLALEGGGQWPQETPVEDMRRCRSFSAADDPATSVSQMNGMGDIRRALDDVQGAFTTESLDQKEANLKKKRSFARPIVKRISFLRRRPTEGSLSHQSAPGKLDKEELKRWALSFENLLKNKHGLNLFRLFLQREFSDENVDFWIACEEFKKLGAKQLPNRAKEIYNEFVAVQSPKEVNLDSGTRTATETAALSGYPSADSFFIAQHRIQNLMEKDSYPRFLKSDLYSQLLNSKK